MPDEISQEHVDRIADALATGKKIQAIKIYREATGQGLKEAKDFIDALIPKLIEQDPDKYSSLAKSQGGGCAAVLVVAIGAGALATLLARLVA